MAECSADSSTSKTPANDTSKANCKSTALDEACNDGSEDSQMLPCQQPATQSQTIYSFSQQNGGKCDTEIICGVGSFHPRWLQKMANKNMFLLVFSMACLLQGMYYTYFASILTTIEKLYQIQSKTTGMIMSATEIGQISSALLLTYYGSHGHRPRWMSCGILVFVGACLLSIAPHFIYNQHHQSSPSTSNFSASHDFNLCIDHSLINSSHLQNMCTNEGAELNAADRQKTHIVLVLLFISLLMIGTGYTAVQTLGIPYIDDNVAPRESPLYFGMTMGIKIFGPVLGFMLGSLCTSIYVNPFDDPGIDASDHSWIGAWWLGILLIAILLVIVAFPMMSFPRRLESSLNSYANQCQTIKSECDRHKAKLKEFPKVMQRLLKNKMLIWRTASSVLHIVPIAGLYTFMPKYLESQFRLTAAKASMTAGLAGMLVMGGGIFMSSLYMRKYKPSPRFVAGWVAICALAYSIGMIILSFIGCDSPSNLANAPKHYDKIHDICNKTCFCDSSKFVPICSSEGVSFASPCHAGCSQTTWNSSSKRMFSQCSCVGDDVTVSQGLCSLQCNNIIWYIIVFTLFVFIHSTSEVGMMLLTLRCVDPQDKTMALGLITFSIGLFGNVPCPIIYGALVDSTCQFWEDDCGQVGACRIYEASMFRKLFHGMTALLMFFAFLVDLVVWFKAKSINFPEYEASEHEQESTNGQQASECAV